MAQENKGGTIAIAREYEQYNSDEVVTASTTYANILEFDAMNIRESTIQITNKGAAILTYKIFGSAKKGQLLSGIDPQTNDAWINLLSTGTYDHTTETSIPVSVAATGTVTCASVQAGDTVTVNGLLYTGVSGVKSGNTQFSVDTSDTACATDLADSITNDTRTGTVTTITQTATNSVGVVTITASVTGALGNSITLVSSNGTRLAVSGATLSNGFDPRAFETFSNPWRYIIVMIKSASGTPTLKIWHRGEN